jgi:hypothetical protein
MATDEKGFLDFKSKILDKLSEYKDHEQYAYYLKNKCVCVYVNRFNGLFDLYFTIDNETIELKNISENDFLEGGGGIIGTFDDDDDIFYDYEAEINYAC